MKLSQNSEIAKIIYAQHPELDKSKVAKNEIPLSIMTQVERSGFRPSSVASALVRLAKEAQAHEPAGPTEQSEAPARRRP